VFRASNVIRRAILPSLLLVGGVGMVVYGFNSRHLPVWEEALVKEEVTEEREIEVPIEVPGLPGPDGFPPDGMPGMLPPPAPPPVKQKVLVQVTRDRETERVVEEPEYALVREITFGGVVLVAPDKLMRTYRRAEAGWDEADVAPPPSLCPT
jgi:hypothetical protein